MKRKFHRLGRRTDGSVAPTVALSLFALVAAAGIAFDYAHLASLDTELQDGADQAALAAVTQLDGNSGAIARATAAAQSLLANKTLFANDNNGSGSAITVPTITFYARATDAEANTNPVTDDATAKFARVAVASRKAYYALTPIVAAIHSPDVDAAAVAGLKSSICKIPPLLMCNPSESSTNLGFDPTAFIGKGIKLVAQGGSGAWAPGDFGYLKNQATGNGAPGLRELLGWDTIPGNCINVTEGDTKPGLDSTVINALNTRFDIFDNGAGQSCPTGGICSPAFNTDKDVIRPRNATACTYGNNGSQWQLPTGSGNKGLYYGSQNFPAATWPSYSVPGTIPSGFAMGFPRDECHATDATNRGANCANGRIGDGTWDVNSYFKVNYMRSTAGSGGAAGTRWSSTDWPKDTGYTRPTRYQIYAWEVKNAGKTIDGVKILGSRDVSGSGATTLTSYGAPQCGTPLSNIPDRRRLSIAVANCSASNVHGNSQNVPIIMWVDVFLVEPSLNRDRTAQGDIYVEVIGETTGTTTTTTGGGQVTRRDVPYLIK